MFREAGMSGQIVSVGKAALQGQGGGWNIALLGKVATFTLLQKYIFQFRQIHFLDIGKAELQGQGGCVEHCFAWKTLTVQRGAVYI